MRSRKRLFRGIFILAPQEDWREVFFCEENGSRGEPLKKGFQVRWQKDLELFA